jgi:dCTP deaminase
MILTGPEIESQVKAKKIKITPFDKKRVNPASYDLALGEGVAVYDDCVECWDYHSKTVEDGRAFLPKPGAILDSKKELLLRQFKMSPKEGWLLRPGILYLMHTAEVVWTDSYVPIIDGKSSIGRLGICVHLTAGFGDAGFNGQYTLEVTTVHPVRVYPGMRFCQIRFHKMEGKVKLYDGNYTGKAAMGPVASRSWKQFG